MKKAAGLRESDVALFDHEPFPIRWTTRLSIRALPSEADRAVAFAADHGAQVRFNHDGSETFIFPRGSVTIPRIAR